MRKLVLSLLLVGGSVLSGGAAMAEDAPDAVTRGTFQGVLPVVKFDVSPPLRDMVPLIPLPKLADKEEDVREIEDDFDTGHEVPGTGEDFDPFRQLTVGEGSIPAPLVSFNAQTNISGVSPPDPVGDVGPNHYVAMSNLHFQIFDKAGNSLFGPAASNTLWQGFGGACEAENAGDPVVLYDQFDDRWILTQFTAAAAPFFNCIAVSQTADPTGAYYRWAVMTGTTGANFPDYPKYGIWRDGLFISTREFAGASFAGVGAYAVNLPQLVAGNPTPQVIFFVVPPGGSPFNVGDGLLPADVDGATPPPPGTPAVYLGSMDQGGPYGAPQDALTYWKFDANWATPASSSFVLTNTIPIGPFDTIFPCTPGARDCISQPGTSQKIDILSYRQRPLHRLAYRNFGDHEALVTNQSVEAAAGVAGIRWWELRDLATTPTVFQEGTYAPADGVQRWMASAAMDNSGNIAMGFSAASGTVFPSLRYTGRLSGDTPGTMGLGEGEIVAGTGSQTGSPRWGDYTSLNIDPIDDCTFWYVNEFVPTSSAVGWRLRVGAFKFDQCGTPDFYFGSAPGQSVCAGTDAVYTIAVGSISDFDNDVALATDGLPSGAIGTFVPNPVTPPGSTTLTVQTTGVAAGSYPFDVEGTATASPGHSRTLMLTVFDAAGGAPALTTPTNGATDQILRPELVWAAGSQAQTYDLEVATDAGFSNVVYSQVGLTGTSHTVATALEPVTQYFWHVRSGNACGTGSYSSAFSFTTRPIPPVLLVDDDDDAPDVLATYTAAVTTESPFDIWDVVDEGGEPTLSDLTPYELVIWFSGDRFTNPATPSAGPQAAAEAALGSFLDLGGRCVWISGQDYLWDMGGANHNVATSFMTNYLGVGGTISSDNGDYTSVTGQNLFAGIGPSTLTYPFSDFSDVLNASATGRVAFVGNNSNVGGVSKFRGSSIGIYFAFPWEAFSAGDRATVMGRVFDVCTSAIFADGFEAGNLNAWSAHVP